MQLTHRSLSASSSPFSLTLVHLHDQPADLFPLLSHLLPWEPVVQAYRQLKVHYRVLRSQSDISVQSRDTSVPLSFSFRKKMSCFVRLRDGFVSFEVETDAQVCVYL